MTEELIRNESEREQARRQAEASKRQAEMAKADAEHAHPTGDSTQNGQPGCEDIYAQDLLIINDDSGQPACLLDYFELRKIYKIFKHGEMRARGVKLTSSDVAPVD